jgi:hypothetical protein
MPRAALLPLLVFACTPTASGGDDDTGGSTGGATGEPDAPTSASDDTGPPPEPYTPVDGNAFPWSAESTDEVCDDGVDNDDNDYADCEDFACSRNPSVFACGADSVYESTPELCANGGDDDGDRLNDCEDPDCFKNPFHATCEKPRSETDCAGGGDADGDGLAGCDDADCRVDVALCPPAAGSLRILFDQTLDETAAAGPNSDWVVDRWGRLPAPSNPASADDWHGALSGFGFALFAAGHRIESLVPWDGRLTHGDAGNPQDLANYDVLVLVEPSRRIKPEEQVAIVRFVLAGGGLLAVANHRSADRDGNGVSAPEAFNWMFEDNAVMPDPFGFRFEEVDEDAPPPGNILAADHPVIDGPAGRVEKIGFFTGCTARVTGPGATGLIALADASKLVVGASEAGDGRVVFVTDSALLGDGTDSHGNTLLDHDAWNDPAQDNAALALNAIAWLGE